MYVCDNLHTNIRTKQTQRTKPRAEEEEETEIVDIH